jgi:hypothetical protein
MLVIAHAQKIMVSCISIIPPHAFKQPSRKYYRVQELKNYECAVLTNGVTSITDFMKILTHIIRFYENPYTYYPFIKFLLTDIMMKVS